MDPKSGKSLRLYNPLSLWLKSGEAMLAAAQEAVARAKAPRVAVIPSADAPPRKKAKPARARNAKAKAKTGRKNAASRARRRGR